MYPTFQSTWFKNVGWNAGLVCCYLYRQKKWKSGISCMPGVYVKRLLLRVVNYADISKSCSLGSYFYWCIDSLHI